jgi:hypothetical protein
MMAGVYGSPGIYRRGGLRSLNCRVEVQGSNNMRGRYAQTLRLMKKTGLRIYLAKHGQVRVSCLSLAGRYVTFSVDVKSEWRWFIEWQFLESLPSQRVDPLIF